MPKQLKTAFAYLLSITLGLFAFYFVKNFLEGEAMSWFVWNINTFGGMFSGLPTNLPKEDIIGSYAFMFKDFYAHAPKSVAQNSTWYALILGAVAFCSSLVFFPTQINNEASKHIKSTSSYAVIILLGFWARFFLAYHTTGNHDMASWYINKDILDSGENIYAVTDRYNYSPFWFWIVGGLSKIHRALPQFPFMFTLRMFLALIDVATLSFVVKIAKTSALAPEKAAALFFLNPISIVITGYHGQFDNIPVLFLLGAIYTYVRFKERAHHLSWLMVTIGTVVKHEILPQVLIVLTHMKRAKRAIFLLFSFTVILFIATFIPYWKDGADGIISNVFGYGAISRPYGLIQFHISPVIAAWHKYLFVGLTLCWPFYFKTANLLRSTLIGILLFLVFASGISAQQFVLPLALAALQPSIGFYLFTLTGTLFLLGNIDELKLLTFKYINWNYVWFSALLWFVIELRRTNLHRVKND